MVIGDVRYSLDDLCTCTTGQQARYDLSCISLGPLSGSCRLVHPLRSTSQKVLESVSDQTEDPLPLVDDFHLLVVPNGYQDFCDSPSRGKRSQ